MQNIIQIANGILIGGVGGGGGVSPPFAPSDIAGLKLWLDADAANVNTEAAADFDGINQYLSSTSNAFNKGNESFSSGGWVKFDNVATQQSIIAKWDSSASKKSYLLWNKGSAIEVVLSNDGTTNNSRVSSAVSISSSVWYFCVFVYDSVNNLLKISVNAETFVTTTDSIGPYNPASPYQLDFARIESGYYGNQQQDLAFFYDKALSQSEVTALYNLGNAIAYDSLSAAQKTDLVSWWSLSETSGTRYDQNGTNNLTDNNSVGWAAGVLDEPVVNDSPVSRWLNKGTGTLNGTQSTAIAQPIWKSSGFGTNSKPYLVFDGTNSFLSLGTEYSKIPEHTLFTVHIRGNNLDDSQAIIADGSGTGAGSPSIADTSIVHRYRNSEVDTIYGNSNANDYRITRTNQKFISTTDVYISMDSKENAVASNTIKVNGTTYSARTIAGSATTIAGTPTATSIGKWGGESYGYFDGDIAETLLYNSVLTASEIESVETYLNAKYAAYSPPGAFIIATGGTITTDGDYKVHSFSSSAEFTVTSLGTDPTYGDKIDYLAVAGGGGGGTFLGAGGGSGGLLTATSATVSAIAYAATVGAGGAGATVERTQGGAGSNSTFYGVTAVGGGGGAANGSGQRDGVSGGSGGGAVSSGTPGAGTAGQGNEGGAGSGTGVLGQGGGGGAGAVGGDATSTNGGDGGVGLQNSITGTALYYAGGGGGSAYAPSGGIAGEGGEGGGGDGGTTAGSDADANTGGGGGGSDRDTVTPAGGNGGSGIVIVRYKFQ